MRTFLAMFLSAQGKHEEARAQLTDAVIRNAEVDPDIAYSVASVYALEDLGLAVIDLDYRESRRRDEHGNWFRYRAKIRDARDAHLGRWTWDVFLAGSGE